LSSEVVGTPLVFQHTPRLLTDAPPSLVTLPPPEAVVGPLGVTAAVVTVGEVAVVFAVIVAEFVLVPDAFCARRR
jgi:hypothetical protein